MKNFERIRAIQKIASMVLCGLFLLACGGAKHDLIAKVKPEKVSITGDLAKYLEIVDNEYEISGDWGGKLSIKLKSKEKVPDDLLKGKDFSLKLSLLGENGMPVSGTQDFNLEYASTEKVKSLLTQTSNEEVILFTGGFGYDAEKDAERVRKFTVSSSLSQSEAANTSSPSSGNDETAVATGSENWDKLLDDYDAYVDSYIKLYKKSKDGDESALTEYPAMMERAANLENSLKKAQDDNNLSTKHATRMLKIQTKMVNVMSN